MSEETTTKKNFVSDLLEKISPENNRWFVVIGALLIQLALGTIYTWGNVTKYVTPYLDSYSPTEGSQTLFIFALGLFSFAITMIFAGQLQQKIGPMKVGLLGGVIVTIGVISSSFMTTLGGMLITYGLIFGVGIGFAYVTPIACAAKWFPDKKGLINGIAVAGFGAGAFFFNIIATAFVNPGDIASDDPAVLAKVPGLFILLGIIYFVMIVAGSLTLQNPKEGYVPEGWTPPAPKEGEATATTDVPRNEAIKKPQFWMLWGMFALTAAAGLFTIGYYSTFGKTATTWEGDLFLSQVGAWAALFNGLGRVVWGKLSDMIGYKKVIFINFGIQAALMVTFAFTLESQALFFIWVCLIYFSFGGNFSLYPTATTDLFGAKNLGPNYGVIFTAYGIAGVTGALLAKPLGNLFGPIGLFITMGIFSIIALVLNYLLKPVEK
ncbi:MAG: L-lactate MFS transporter [Promethearchaeota archaeon]